MSGRFSSIAVLILLAGSSRLCVADEAPLEWISPLRVALQESTQLPSPITPPVDPMPAAEPVQPAETREIPPQLARPIVSLGTDISSPVGRLPDDAASSVIDQQTVAMLPPSRCWPGQDFHWAAAATRHRPLRFEEINAERYGYTKSRLLQPVISSAHFFGTIPALPYLRGAYPPSECIYTLGHYRPGQCNPWRRHRWPVSLRGAACEACVVTGMVFTIP